MTELLTRTQGRGVDVDQAGGASEPTLSDYARLDALTVLVVLVCALVGVGIAAGVAWRQDPVYRATAVIAATPQPPGADGDVRAAPSVDSDAQVLTSARVLANAAEQVAYPGGEPGLRDAIAVSARPNSRVLRVRVTAPTPVLAREAANAIAGEFLRIRAASAAARAEEVRGGLQRQIDTVSNQLEALRAAARASGGEDVALPTQEERALLDEVTRLQGLLVDSTVVTAESGFVAEPAVLPTSGERPQALAVMLGGALLGVLSGLVATGVAVRRPQPATGGGR